MKLTLLVIGKTEAEYLKEGILLYEKRIQHYIPFEIKTITDIKNAKSLNFDQIKEKEGENIISQIKTADYKILLDENGKKLSSREFAELIQKRINYGTKNLCFVIGGAYGFSKKVYQSADEQISLSPMTFSHQMVRLIFIEQLYRAFTILKGEPYHHD